MFFDTGTIIAIAAVLLFYLRLIILQRQRAKAQQSSQGKKARKSLNEPTSQWIVVRVWPLMIIGVLLLIAGAALAGLPWFLPGMKTWWWVPVTLGILLMSLSLG